MSKNISTTALEFLDEYHPTTTSKGDYYEIYDIMRAMQDYAKFHVERALKSVTQNIKSVDITAVLDNYPLSNIK